MKIFKDVPNIKFMNKMKYGFTASALIIILGIVLYFVRGFNFGIDFTGGTNVEISFKNATTIDQLRSTLSKVGLGGSTIQKAGGSSTNRFFIKTSKVVDMEGNANNSTVDKSNTPASGPSHQTGVAKIVEDNLLTPQERDLRASKLDLNNASELGISDFLVQKGVTRQDANASAAKLVELRKANKSLLIDYEGQIANLNLPTQVNTILKNDAFLGSFTFLSVEVVGAQVGHDMRMKATLATVWAMIGMLIYIAFRFRFAFGLSGVLTLVHDVLVTLSFILIFRIEMSLSVIAAILTLVGYSINDTIVVFDRIRDNIKIMKRIDPLALMDLSINQTLSRTIITSLTTFLTVVCLFLFGGEIIYGFSFTLMIGIIIGTYSSIYQSCAWLAVMKTNIFVQKKK